jgi:hypothetical protein
MNCHPWNLKTKFHQEYYFQAIGFAASGGALFNSITPYLPALYIMKTFGNLFRWTQISRRKKLKPKKKKKKKKNGFTKIAGIKGDQKVGVALQTNCH